jgi:hypothetical protein
MRSTKKDVTSHGTGNIALVIALLIVSQNEESRARSD